MICVPMPRFHSLGVFETMDSNSCERAECGVKFADCTNNFVSRYYGMKHPNGIVPLGCESINQMTLL